MSVYDDDIYLGGNVEIGDSSRGMQQGDLVGAGSVALQRLRQQLGGRFDPHVPANKPIRSQYRDSGQIGIVCVATATPASFNGGVAGIPISGQSTVFTSFKPNRVTIMETIIATFTASGQDDVTLATTVDNAADLLVTSAFSGKENCFPNAPTINTGVNASTWQAGAFGVGVSWPTVNAGIPVTLGFLLRRTALYRITAPNGYTLSSIEVTVDTTLLGPQLR